MALPDVQLRPLRREDFPLLSRWLAEPLVARWWHDDTSLDAVEAHYGPSVDGMDPTALYLAEHEGRAFGFVQVYRFDDEPESLAELSAVCPVPPGALSVDYLIGEPAARGRGLGAAMIAAAVARGSPTTRTPGSCWCRSSPRTRRPGGPSSGRVAPGTRSASWSRTTRSTPATRRVRAPTSGVRAGCEGSARGRTSAGRSGDRGVEGCRRPTAG